MKTLISTRGNAAPANAPEAILRGIASDGGLYTPAEIPHLDVREMIGLDFAAVAKKVLGEFLPGYTAEEIDDCVEEAYADRFDDPSIVPLESVGSDYVLELHHGPTAAFKDVALSILPRLMCRAMKKCSVDHEIMILTATSGDTGSAALTGFCDVPGIRIVTFYPEKGISPVQRAQMTTMQGDNVGVCAVSDNFDAAQTGVKRIFSDLSHDFLKENGVSLSSANSINFGRLAPQIVYYYCAYLDLMDRGAIRMGEKVNFSVPTGNFGDILAGYLARESGLPIGRLICASNENRVLTDFLNTGVYDSRREFHVTASPSMDILVSSNLERMLFYAADGNSELVSEKMDALKQTGRYDVSEIIQNRLKSAYDAQSVTDAESFAAIRSVFDKYGYIMDPHTAVAWKAMELYRGNSRDDAPCVVLSTASPYKFASSVLTALGEDVPEDAHRQMELLERKTGTAVPASLASILDRDVRFRDVVSPAGMMEYVVNEVKRK